MCANKLAWNHFKNKIIYKLFTYKLCMYNNFTVCKQMTDVKLFVLHCNTWNQVDMCVFENVIYKLFLHKLCL